MGLLRQYTHGCRNSKSTLHLFSPKFKLLFLYELLSDFPDVGIPTAYGAREAHSQTVVRLLKINFSRPALQELHFHAETCSYLMQAAIT
jgi:hypothetical protein